MAKWASVCLMAQSPVHVPVTRIWPQLPVYGPSYRIWPSYPYMAPVTRIWPQLPVVWPHLPVTWPQLPVTWPQLPVTWPQLPVTWPQLPVIWPKLPVIWPKLPLYGPSYPSRIARICTRRHRCGARLCPAPCPHAPRVHRGRHHQHLHVRPALARRPRSFRRPGHLVGLTSGCTGGQAPCSCDRHPVAWLACPLIGTLLPYPARLAIVALMASKVRSGLYSRA